MWIINKNSRNIIKIGLTEIGSYLEIDKPVVLDWSDCESTMGRYSTLLGTKDDTFISLTNELNTHTYKDYSENLQSLLIDFQPLFNILENGLYFLNYSKGSENKNFDEHLVFPQLASTEKTFINENEDDVLLFTSEWYYNYRSSFTIATQLAKSINQERIEFYKNEIIQGKRPFIITIYKSYIEDKLTFDKVNEYVEWDSALFLLDGHHKFLAYKELGIHAPSFTICQGFSNPDEIYFDLTKLKKHLNKFQIKHLVENMG
ncbi:hypothetical protein GCM10023210_37490 [Chryseobacterium ginsengisoli]|uniref:Uncharacterized protein n=1 Tax=Chryseobacterium ginsengisoli TaxID=363853 RepID=A0ABP9MUS4_9FLAO